jgi:uncharacterized protein YjlB
VAELNGQEVKLVKVQGTFPWHHHDDVEEMFLVWRGRFRVEFRDRIVELGPGELVVVPCGVEHRTAADEEAEVILVGAGGHLEYWERHRREVHGSHVHEDLKTSILNDSSRSLQAAVPALVGLPRGVRPNLGRGDEGQIST